MFNSGIFVPPGGSASAITGSGTSNFVAKFTSASAIGNSQIFDDGTNVGINVSTSLGAKFTIKSGGQTSATYAVKVQDSLTSPLFYVRDDGYVSVGQDIGSGRLTILGAGATSATYSLYVNNSTPTNTFYVRDDGAVSSKFGYWIDGSKILYINPNGTARNTFCGENSGNNTMTGAYNSAFGSFTLNANTSGAQNAALTDYALINNTTGSFNLAAGSAAGVQNTTGDRNTYLGAETGHLNQTGSNNTHVGNQAGYNSLNVSNCIFIGYQSGYYETVGSKLFIDVMNRGTEAAGRTSALIYGIFNANVYSQRLTINGLTRIHNFTVADMGSASPLNGDITYVTDTDATFTSKGFWGYEEGAWVKL